MRISDWSSDVCSSDLIGPVAVAQQAVGLGRGAQLSAAEAALRAVVHAEAGVEALARRRDRQPDATRLRAAFQRDLDLRSGNVADQREITLQRAAAERLFRPHPLGIDRKSTRLNSSH